MEYIVRAPDSLCHQLVSVAVELYRSADAVINSDISNFLSLVVGYRKVLHAFVQVDGVPLLVLRALPSTLHMTGNTIDTGDLSTLFLPDEPGDSPTDESPVLPPKASVAWAHSNIEAFMNMVQDSCVAALALRQLVR